ncbi:preprotein translocase, SecE subunit [Brevibacterium mcbrellneri ATCC 49030]|uniref:Protein translocase subunit SecE n=1 Tax=Brevibacterium mcbrellneri ATCC 49030 TaxID=585530 RepID=D4YQD6_9MICO|nr:preprotein translocase subunit SecE [Brevibacterium mcbrellneri]EFG46593.1 preprotein translocase, SecE subunit [Brevibacterium mcbrellneri ATCC 49030]
MAESGKGTEAVDHKRRGFFGTIARFFAEVMSELKKVVTPTRKELINMFGVVLGFVVVMIVIVLTVDFVFGKLVGFAFARTPIWPLW